MLIVIKFFSCSASQCFRRNNDNNRIKIFLSRKRNHIFKVQNRLSCVFITLLFKYLFHTKYPFKTLERSPLPVTTFSTINVLPPCFLIGEGSFASWQHWSRVSRLVRGKDFASKTNNTHEPFMWYHYC